MTTLDRLFKSNGHAKVVVVDNDTQSLNAVVSSIRSNYNKASIMGYSDYREFLEELNVAKAKNSPFSIVIVRQRDIRSKFLLETAKKLGSLVFSYDGPDRMCRQIGSNFCLLRQYL